MTAWLIRYRNLLMLGLLVIMLIVTSVRAGRQTDTGSTVTIPVSYTAKGASADPVESYRTRRDTEELHDMAALQALYDNATLEDAIRQKAAERLIEMTEARSIQNSMEGVLLGTALSPCVAVYSSGCLTIITAKEELTEGETTLVLTLADAHAGLDPSCVRVVCTQPETDAE